MRKTENSKFSNFLHKTLRKFKPRFSFHYVAYTLMFFVVVFSVVHLVGAATPNPGHPWIEIGDGNVIFSDPGTPRTYTLPNANATILTTNALVTVGQGGIGVGTLASNGVLYGNGTGAVQALAVNAGATQCLTQASSAAPAWGACGSSYTFSTGLTNSSGTITANLSTGVSGGQSAIGGTAAGNNLTLSSTTNGTKGKIIFGSLSAYDEVNDRFGIGQTSPTARLDIKTDSLGTTQTASSGISLVNTTNAGVGAQQISPAVIWTGQGWKTDATAGSQSVAFRSYVLPSQGSSTPTGSWLLQSSLNGGAYVTRMSIGASDSADTIKIGDVTGGTNLVNITSGGVTVTGSSGVSLVAPAISFLNGSNSMLSFNTTSGSYSFGDLSVVANGSVINLDDTGGSAYYDNSAHNGLFGINTTTPAAALDVVGNGQLTTQSATAFTVARLGTNYALQVDTNTASSVTGLKVTSAGAGGGLALAVISSGTDENLTLDAKGAGTIGIGGNSTGNILLGGGSGSTGCTLTNSSGAFACTSTISSGVAGGTIGGFNLSGNTSGTISILPQAAAGTYNFNLPTTAGNSGEILTSAGGAGAPMTWTAPGALAVRWNSIVNPTGSQSLTFDDGELNAWTVSSDTETFHTITANSLTTGKVLSIASSSLTTGSLIDLAITGTAASVNQTGLNISLSGANASLGVDTYGIKVSNTHTDGSSLAVNNGVYASTTGQYGVSITGTNSGGGVGVLGAITSSTNFGAVALSGSVAGDGYGVQVTSTRSASTGNFAVTLESTTTGTFNTAGGAADSYAGYFSSTTTRSAGANALTNIGLYATASGAQNNYAAIFEAGNVGIGDTSPTALLTVGASDVFQVNSSGAIAASTGIISTKSITDTGSLVDLNLTLGNDANADTVSALNIDVTSVATGADGDSLYGVNVANLTSADADVAESALFVGTGWDKILDTGALDISQAGVISGATGITSSGTITFSSISGSTQCLQVNSSGVVSGTGSACGSGGGLTVGTTTITSGSSGNILYNNAGILGEMTTTGSGTVVALATSPSITTSLVTGSTSFDLVNTTATTLNIGGAATTFALGGTPTTTLTANLFTNATAAATTKTINLGTGAAASSTTNINIGSANGGTTTINSPTTALGTGSITMTGSLGTTGARLTKGWFTDLEVTNAIVGSITGSAPTLTTSRNLWGQSFNGSADVTGSLTSVGDITGGASSMIITAGTGNSRTMTLRSTTAGGTATAFLTGNADQSSTFGGNISGTGSWTLTGGAGNMTITAGTGNSRTMALQTTTAGGTATTFLTGNADQSATFANVVTGGNFTVNATTVPVEGMYRPTGAGNLGFSVSSAAELLLTSTAFSPAADGGNSLGTTALGWQNLFGNTGFVLNIENGDWVATHTSGILTVGTGDLRVTTAGTNSASVVTVGGTQTLTGKTINLSSNTLSGTTAEFNTALSDNDFATLAGSETLSNKTLTAPKFADLGFIADANGNELIILDTTTSAVNEWTLANGATGVNPKLTASGEANVGLDFQVKGTGVYNLLATTSGPTDLRLFEDADNGTNYVSFIAPATLAGNQVLTLPDATDTLVGKATTDVFTNKTLTSSTNVLGGVTMTLGSDANYDTYYRNSSGVLTRLANGSTGNCLNANTGAAPSWGSCGGGSTNWDTIGDAGGDGAIAMGATVQTMDWGTASTQAAMTFNANSLTTGQLLTLSSTNAMTTTGKLLSVSGNTATTTTGLATISATGLTTGFAQAITLGTALTTGGALNITGASYNPGAGNTGSLASLSFTNAGSNTSGANIVNGINVSSTVNTSGATGTKQTNAINVASPTLTGCTGGTCSWYGLNITAPTTASNINSTAISITASNFSKDNTSATGVVSAVAGLYEDLTFTDSAGKTQVGNRMVISNAPTTNANTSVGQIIRTTDNTSLANTVRGIEIVSSVGSNVAGTNTGLRATGATFGVQGLTTGLAGDVVAPAALYGEMQGTTQGDALRLYSTTITSSPQMAYFYHSTSTFTGTGLLMDMATGSGTFSGNFVDFQNNNTSKFKVDSSGQTTLTLDGTASTSAVCGSHSTGTSGDQTGVMLTDCSGAPAADYAEMYPVENDTEYGDIVTTGSELINTYDTTNGNIDWNKIKGKITKLVKSNSIYQKNVVGIVVDNHGDFTSSGYNLKETDNPMPVALNGRVPVKVASDSDNIMPGDYITTSNESGKATKATKAGAVIGKALEVWTRDSGAKTVMVYVEQGFYNGEAVSQFAGIDPLSSDLSKQALKKFMQSSNNMYLNSEILADRVSAGLEIITPKLIADNVSTNIITSSTGENIGLVISDSGKFTIGGTINRNGDGTSSITNPAITFDNLGNATFNGKITAKEIQVSDLSGIEDITNQINQLAEGQIAFNLTAQAMNALTGAITLAQTDITNIKNDISLTNQKVEGLTVLGADIDNRLKAIESVFASNSFNNLTSISTSALAVQGQAQFDGSSIFNGEVKFGNQTEFNVPPLFNKNTAGYALIKQGDRRARIEFSQPYIATPVVNTSVTFETTDNVDDAEASTLFSNDVRFVIVGKDQTGFTILLNKNAPRDVRFSWNALAVKDPSIFESVFEGLIVEPTPISELPKEENPTTGPNCIDPQILDASTNTCVDPTPTPDETPASDPAPNPEPTPDPAPTA